MTLQPQVCTLLSVSCQVDAKFGTCTVVGLNGTLVEAKMFTLTLECTHFFFNKCPIETHNGANATLRTSCEGTDYSARCIVCNSIHIVICMKESELKVEKL